MKTEEDSRVSYRAALNVQLHVEFLPPLDDLAAGKARDMDAADVHFLASGRNVHQLTLVRAMGRESGHDPIPFGDLVLDMEMHAGESGQEHIDDLSPALARWGNSGRCTMVDKVWRDQFVKDVQSPLVERFIQSAYGGSKIEPWMTIEALKQVPSLNSAVEYVEGSDQVHRGHIAEALKDLEIYLPMAKKAFEAGEKVPVPMKWPVHPLTRDKQQPTCLFNGMINPIVPFAIRGVIWYQGEANSDEGMLYYNKFKAMLASWRSRWGQGNFPFYFVQLAP